MGVCQSKGRQEGWWEERMAVPGGAIKKPSKPYELEDMIAGCRAHGVESSAPLSQCRALRASVAPGSMCSVCVCGRSE